MFMPCARCSRRATLRLPAFHESPGDGPRGKISIRNGSQRVLHDSAGTLPPRRPQRARVSSEADCLYKAASCRSKASSLA